MTKERTTKELIRCIAAGGFFLLAYEAVDHVATATIPGHQPTVEVFALQASAATSRGQDLIIGDVFTRVDPEQERQRISDQDSGGSSSVGRVATRLPPAS